MLGGKRLPKGKISHQQDNFLSDIEKLNFPTQGNDGKYDRIGVAVKDSLDTTIINNYYFVNSTDNSFSHHNYTEKSGVSPLDSHSFNGWEFLAVSLLLSISEILLYDYIAPTASKVGVVIATIFTIFPPGKWLPDNFFHILKNLRRSFFAGIVFSIIFTFIFCGYFGFRLDIWQNEIEPPPAPTAIATPSPSSPENDTEVPSQPPVNSYPPTDTPPSDDPQPPHIQSDFFTLIQYSVESQESVPFAALYMDFWRTTFLSEMEQIVASKQPLDVSPETYAEFERKTKEANDLYAQFPAQTDNVVAIEEIIQLREAAYELNPVASVCNLLADNYHTLAIECTTIGNWDEAYSNYYNAVKWKLTYIQFLDQADDSFYNAVYFIATAYHGMSALEQLSDSEKNNALYISACLFGISSQNSFSSGDKQYLSCLYAGMVNHDLLNKIAETSSPDNVAFFSEAYKFYCQALEFPSRDKKRIYEYLSDICTWAWRYSSTNQGVLPLDSATYKEDAIKYKQLSM